MVKWILRYLNGTIDIELLFKKDCSQQCVGYCDSDFARDLDKRRSTMGYVFISGGGPVSWRSILQLTIALSTTETEYMTATEASQRCSHFEDDGSLIVGSDLNKFRRGERLPDKMQIWRNALTEAANLSGSEEIVNAILKRLDDTFQSETNDLVGVELPMKEIESLLRSGSTNVCTLGIWGIGGIGKTTIAGAIFNKISRHSAGSYFANNVREAEETGRLGDLRQQLLSTLLNDGNVKSFPNIGLNFQSKRLTRKKVLIVFYDVNHPRQIEFLVGRLDLFASGSRIIITTRDRQLLTNCGVDEKYQMKELVHADALKLFSRHAFGGDHPYESHTELTCKTIKYARGVPLALKVWVAFFLEKRRERGKMQ
ncbi:hypothetical protein WN943_014281 [Citrus x changshan-huyou]